MLTTMKSQLQLNYSQAFELFPEFKAFQANFKNKYQEVKENLTAAGESNSKLDYYKWLDFNYLEAVNKKTIELACSIKKRQTLKNIFSFF